MTETKPLSESVEYLPEDESNLIGDVLKLLRLPDDDETLRSQVSLHLGIVTSFVWSYTRGKGFQTQVDSTARRANRDIRNVIVSVTARYVTNPEQLKRESAGNQTITYATLDGFTLAERAVLNMYRRRTA